MSLLFWDESEYLISKIETIRKQMVKAAEKKSLIDENVVKLRIGHLPCEVSEI